MFHIFVPDIPLLEKIVRSVIVYAFMLFAFRFTGKRLVGQLTPFDLIVLLIISNVVQNALIGNDTSLGGGLIGATTIFVLNFGIVELVYRSRRARHLLEPHPTLLIHRGRILHQNLKRELITLDDMYAAIRRHGCATLEEVDFAVLEETGDISVVPRARESVSQQHHVV